VLATVDHISERRAVAQPHDMRTDSMP
jgi:hypothetical protein